jgi:hypothetical protein
MEAWNSADVALFAIAGYIAIVSLVRLMLSRRDALMRQLHDDLERQRSLAAERERNAPAASPATAGILAAKKKA